MKKSGFLFFYLFLVSSLASALQTAPVTTLGPGCTGGPGLISVPVTITGFNNIGSISLEMDFTYAVLHFVGWTPNTQLTPFLVSDNDLGNGKHRLIMSWFGSGTTLGDGSAIVTLTFDYLGGNSPMAWYENGISCEYADGNGDALPDTPTGLYYRNSYAGTLPAVYQTGGGGDFCQGHGSGTITLDGSETGVTYELLNGGSPTGTTLPGTGDPLSFETILAAGTYTIKATNDITGCWAIMDGSALVVVSPSSTISGTLKYYKMTGSAVGMPGVELWLVTDLADPAGTKVASCTTGTTPEPGSYQFNIICIGDYYIYVNDNPYSVGGINATDAAQANYWGVNPYYDIPAVKFLAGDVHGDYFISATDAFDIQSFFVHGVPFIRATDAGTPYAYWKAGDTPIHSNYSPYNGPSEWPASGMGVHMPGTPVTMDILAQLYGDFNSSYTPTGGKEAWDGLELTEGETLNAGPGEEIIIPLSLQFPVPSSQNSGSRIADRVSRISAISLILDFPTDLLAIEDVTVTGSSVPADWTVNGNELRIGWNSIDPLTVSGNDPILTLHARTTDRFSTGQTIRFALASDPLNELANDLFQPVPATLIMPSFDSNPGAVSDQQSAVSLDLACTPNPVTASSRISYNLPFDGVVAMEIFTLAGIKVMALPDENQVKGEHSVVLRATDLGAGMYTATLRLKGNGEEIVRTIKLVKN
jgi:hypothetical protein